MFIYIFDNAQSSYVFTCLYVYVNINYCILILNKCFFFFLENKNICMFIKQLILNVIVVLTTKYTFCNFLKYFKDEVLYI